MKQVACLRESSLNLIPFSFSYSHCDKWIYQHIITWLYFIYKLFPSKFSSAAWFNYLFLFLILLAVVVQLLSRVWLFVTPWTVAHQAPLFMGFSRQEYWRGLPCPPLRDLPNPGMKPRSPALQADSLLSEPHTIGESCWTRKLSLLFSEEVRTELDTQDKQVLMWLRRKSMWKCLWPKETKPFWSSK